MTQLDIRLSQCLTGLNSESAEIWATSAALMMGSKKWEVRMGGANAAIKMIEKSDGDIRDKLRAKFADEATIISLSKDEVKVIKKTIKIRRKKKESLIFQKSSSGDSQKSMTRDIIMPDPNDPKTVLAIGRRTYNAYYEPSDKSWINIPGWSVVC